MSLVLRHDFSVSEKDYLNGEELSHVPHEYLNGVVYGMAGGTRAHAAIAGNIFAALHGQLRSKRCRAYHEAMRLRIERGEDLRFYYPDAMVVCQESASEVWEDAPSVVVEVLSDGTDRVGLGEKRDAYFGIASLHTYLVVDSRRMEVTVFHREGDSWTAAMIRDAAEVIHLPEIECELGVAEIYEGALQAT